MPQRIYLDNASTTYPKPPCVAEAAFAYMTEAGTNVGRGDYSSAFAVEDIVFECRERLCTLLGGADPSLVAFTRNVTESLNLVLKGLLEPGDHVIVSSMEHNAVMRPLMQLRERGVTFSRAQCAGDGTLDAAGVEALIGPATRAVVMTHASNVCGTVLPVDEVGAVCERHGLLFIVDAAQTAGAVPLDMRRCRASAICFTGHKGLLGPQGTGGALFAPGVAERVEPLVAGGTGSASDSELMPAFMPDRLEAGTPNLPGIAGLHAALGWLLEQPEGAVLAHERALTERLLAGLSPLQARGLVRTLGLPGPSGRTGVVSIQTPGRELASVAHELDARHGIQARVGLHCAPSAHRTLGTFPTGTIRFSVGWSTTGEDIDRALAALTDTLG